MCVCVCVSLRSGFREVRVAYLPTHHWKKCHRNKLPPQWALEALLVSLQPRSRGNEQFKTQIMGLKAEKCCVKKTSYD